MTQFNKAADALAALTKSLAALGDSASALFADGKPVAEFKAAEELKQQLDATAKTLSEIGPVISKYKQQVDDGEKDDSKKMYGPKMATRITEVVNAFLRCVPQKLSFCELQAAELEATRARFAAVEPIVTKGQRSVAADLAITVDDACRIREIQG